MKLEQTYQQAHAYLASQGFACSVDTHTEEVLLTVWNAALEDTIIVAISTADARMYARLYREQQEQA